MIVRFVFFLRLSIFIWKSVCFVLSARGASARPLRARERTDVPPRLIVIFVIIIIIFRIALIVIIIIIITNKRKVIFVIKGIKGLKEIIVITQTVPVRVSEGVFSGYSGGSAGPSGGPFLFFHRSFPFAPVGVAFGKRKKGRDASLRFAPVMNQPKLYE